MGSAPLFGCGPHSGGQRARALWAGFYAFLPSPERCGAVAVWILTVFAAFLQFWMVLSRAQNPEIA